MIPVIRPDVERGKNFVWLASYPKSGSTWLRMVARGYFLGEVDINASPDVDLGDMEDDLYEKVSPIPLDDLLPAECFHLRMAALFRMSLVDGDKIVKTHCCNGMVHGTELIPQAFTKAAIYIARDPRDVAISYADHMGISIDHAIERMGDFRTMAYKGGLRQHLGTWSQHVESWLRDLPYRVLAIRYEDMLANPEGVFAMVMKFITSEPVDLGRLNMAIEAASFENLKRQEEEKGFVEKSRKQERFFRAGKSTWRDVLNRDQVDRIEKDHGETMRKMGCL